MKMETWTAVACLGLSVMFVTLLLSFYNFLIGPDGKGPQRVVEPGSLLLQLVFISAAPSLVLAGVVFALSKSYGDRPGGILLVAAGIVMIAGMAVGTIMIPKILNQYIVGGVAVVPYIFMGAGIGVVALGGYLLAMSKRRPTRYSDLDDLR
jgi:hypothetical protein